MAGKLPAYQLYTGDWFSDLALQCGMLAEIGAAAQAFNFMHKSIERGVMMGHARPMADEEVARLISRGDIAEARQCLAVLLERGVLRRRESDGAIYSKRMVEDEAERQKKIRAGSLGGGAKSAARGEFEAGAKSDFKQTASKRLAEPVAESGSSSSFSSSVSVSDGGVPATGPPAAAAFSSEGLFGSGLTDQQVAELSTVLVRHGFDVVDAGCQVRQFGEERIRTAVGNLEFDLASGCDPPRKRTGWLIARMRAGGPLKPGAVMATTDREGPVEQKDSKRSAFRAALELRK